MDNSTIVIALLVGLIQIILILEILHIAQNTKDMKEALIGINHNIDILKKKINDINLNNKP